MQGPAVGADTIWRLRETANRPMPEGEVLDRLYDRYTEEYKEACRLVDDFGFQPEGFEEWKLTPIQEYRDRSGGLSYLWLEKDLVSGVIALNVLIDTADNQSDVHALFMFGPGRMDDVEGNRCLNDQVNEAELLLNRMGKELNSKNKQATKPD